MNGLHKMSVILLTLGLLHVALLHERWMRDSSNRADAYIRQLFTYESGTPTTSGQHTDARVQIK
jgi:hypothetical protein